MPELMRLAGQPNEAGTETVTVRPLEESRTVTVQ